MAELGPAQPRIVTSLPHWLLVREKLDFQTIMDKERPDRDKQEKEKKPKVKSLVCILIYHPNPIQFAAGMGPGAIGGTDPPTAPLDQRV